MISQILGKVAPLGWFLPGFLLWAAFPPMGEKIDALFALAPLIWLSRREVSARISAKRWFQSGAFFWLATLSWMPAIVKNGGPWPLVALGWFALSAYCAAFFAAYGWLSARCWRRLRDAAGAWSRRGRSGAYAFRLFGVLVVEPALWCGLELVRSRLFGGFAWNQLGVVAVNAGFGAPAALGGVYLCSAAVLLVNGTVAGIAERMWRPERTGFAGLRHLGALDTLLAFAVVCGLYAVSPPPRTGGAPPLKVAMIQRNFPCAFQTRDENPVDVYAGLLGNVSELRPDLVVLPESAMCEFGPVDAPGPRRFADWVRGRTGAALLAGGSRSAGGEVYNSAALYSTNGVQVYDKVHLVPFGEFIPGDKIFPALQKLAPVGSCSPGELKTLRLETEGRPAVGVAICFEDTDSAQMRALAAKGAQLLFFITNDSWFSNSIEAEQHAWQSTARAVETGLTAVRVGNSGVTGTIAPDGSAAWLVGDGAIPLVDARGTMFDRVSPAPPGAATPPYVRLGDIPLFVIFTLLIVGIIMVEYIDHHEKRRILSM